MQVSPFQDCYDAVKRYQGKDVMDTIPAEDLNIGDLVLMEAFVTRYPTNQNNTRLGGKITAKERAKVKAKGPTEWKVTFELSSVALLHSAPPPQPDEFRPSGPVFTVSI